jgi:hypothetical protein
MLVPEAERKAAVFRGVCIARYDKGIRSSFKLYNVYPDAGGVVQHIPLYMTDLLAIKVVGHIPAKQVRSRAAALGEQAVRRYDYGLRRATSCPPATAARRGARISLAQARPVSVEALPRRYGHGVRGALCLTTPCQFGCLACPCSLPVQEHLYHLLAKESSDHTFQANVVLYSQ